MLLALSLVTLLLGALTAPAFGTDVPTTLKDRLFVRYDQKNMKVTHEKLLVTGLNGSASNPLDYSINYDHFHPAIAKKAWPKKYLKRNLIDEYTTEEVEPGARFTDTLAPQEMIRVRKFLHRGEQERRSFHRSLSRRPGWEAGHAPAKHL